MAEPNTALRAVRAALHMSQDELAKAVRAAGDQAGEPNDCTKRLVQRWEAGLVTQPRGIYVRALEAATGQPIENLDRSTALGMRDDTLPEAVEVPGGPLTGIWLSRYEYVSSGRGDQTLLQLSLCGDPAPRPTGAGSQLA
jgi:transcriptional regulator with XRE-family HTH domain